ncbi:MAG: NYN domain-containing protein [Lachnospiraceae bacterium]|nr:NYN domain-containing protein [Lachnospiraceae bacterium]
MDDNRYALLIDSDNVSAKYISGILDEITKYGVATYKRIYGDWTSTQANKWKEELLVNSIVPIQQFSNTVGKNATDSALIIDAMDILYGGSVEGFCIVSSDSDFTRLASRLRESGMSVLGMGEEKTPMAFRNACTKFVNLENLLDPGEEVLTESIDKNAGTVLSQSLLESTIADIISENANKGKLTGLGEIGSRLSNKYPDFDVRNYGYSYLSKFLEELPEFELDKQDSTIMVGIRDNAFSMDAVVKFIKKSLKTQSKGMDLSELSNQVHREFPDFKLKDFGYSQFYKFIQNISGIEVSQKGTNHKMARLKSV